MAAEPNKFFRLARDGRHAYLDESGAFIGRGVPFLERTEEGRWRVRPQATLERLLSIGYGERFELGWRTTKLSMVARALDAGDQSLAAIALQQAEFPPLPDEAAALRMSRADGNGTTS